jgi:siderophore synthetase component
MRSQWEAQYNPEDEDGLQEWYESDHGGKETKEATLPIKEQSQTSSPFVKVDENKDLSKKELLEMMMMHQERTLEKIITATAKKDKSSSSEKDKDWLEESKLKSVELEPLEDLVETTIKGTSSIKFGDWL